MDPMNVALVIGMLLSVGGTLYPVVKNYLPTFSGKTPHKAVEELITFFKARKNEQGTKVARECGKLLYDAVGEDNGTKN